jgi:glycosyltransferase involved in cell wall biosynthesis
MSLEEKRTGEKCWSVAAPFFYPGAENRWIGDFVSSEHLEFRKVLRRPSRDNWHTRSRGVTGLNTWLDYWHQSEQAFPASGIVTLFPQLALTASVQKRLFRRQVPLLAWCFNLGHFPRGWKRAAARTALKGVDRFVVHSTGEIRKVSEFLDIAPNRVEFVPLQRAPIPVVASEELNSPFVVSMGSANRDYATFFKAAEISKLPCIVVASQRSVDGLAVPANVALKSGLEASECHRLVQRSRLSVVPLLDPEIASGQVTVVDSMRMNRPVIATESVGTRDYVQSGSNGVLVPARDPEALAAAMLELWNSPSLREQYATNASSFAERSLSDQAAAGALVRIISHLAADG